MGNLHGVGRPSDWGLRFHAARTSALLSALFLIVYGGANWLTSQRTDVGTWYFGWELGLPLVPLMIVPYMTLDLFFVASPFLCTSRREMTVLAQRIVFGILIAGVFFLAMPLRLMHERTPVEGWIGTIFEAFRGMDQPFNLFPSLHITLRTILAVTYARHTRGLVKAACQVWFSLIGISTILTHQHHLVDIAGGFVLAVFALHLFREESAPRRVTPNFRIAGYYAAATVTVVGAALMAMPWGAFLLWPAGALAIVTSAYLGAGPRVFCKSSGRLPSSTRFVLAPILLGQYLSLLHYRRRSRAWDEVVPGVLIGRKLSNREAAEAVRHGVTAVLDLTAEFSEAAPFLGMRYLNVPILDLTPPTPQQLDEAVTFITEEAVRGTVYVHCKVGYSRSAAMVGAYLIATDHAASMAEAVDLLRQARPSIVIRAEALAAIRQYAARHHVAACVI